MAYTKDNGRTQAGITSIILSFTSAEPPDPVANECVQWVSNGTGAGDAGDVMMKINDGTTVKTVTLVDFSAA